MLAIDANIGATFLIALPIPTNIFCINFPKAAKGLKRPSTFSPISVNASIMILAKVFTPSITRITARTAILAAKNNWNQLPQKKAPSAPANISLTFPTTVRIN